MSQPNNPNPWDQNDPAASRNEPRTFPYAEQYGSQNTGTQTPQGNGQGSAPSAYGSGSDSYGSAPDGYGAPQGGSSAYGQQYGQGSAPQQNSQHPQQYGQQEPFDYDQQQGQPAGYGQQPQSFGAPDQPYNQSADQGNTQDQGSQPAPQAAPAQNSNPQGSAPQGYQGILDPRTGEIHPVPDLNNLHDSDALLVVVSGPDAGAQILLDTDVVTVGRSPNADIFLDDVTVSRKHAEFVRTPAGFTLRDTGSLNGTYVGRQLIDSIELQNGADVQIGKFRMIFQQRPRTA